MTARVLAFMIFLYLLYSFTVYIYGTKTDIQPSTQVQHGFDLWQKKNCQACHQLYGLGGYMGPDLTNIMSNPQKGATYAYVFMKAGSARMPNFKLSDTEISDLSAFLKWVDSSGQSYVPADKVTWYGSYNLEGK